MRGLGGLEGPGPGDPPPGSQKQLYRCAWRVGSWERNYQTCQAFSSPARLQPQNKGASLMALFPDGETEVQKGEMTGLMSPG